MAVGYLYPWDVVGDPAAAARVAGLGFDRVALATAYHGVRAATPRHPRRRLLDTPAALHRAGRAPWTDDPDPVATATAALAAVGVGVLPWVVLTHSSTVGARQPSWCAHSALGDRFDWALCPSWPPVRAHAAALAAAALAPAPVPWAGVVLEALGPMGARHNGRHEKTDAHDAATWELLSVCCCRACGDAQAAAGADPAAVRDRLRTALLDGRAGGTPRAGEALGELAGPVLAAREAGTAALVEVVLAAVRPAVAGPVHVHADPDPWATGAAPALTPALAAVADSAVVPAWAPGSGAAAVRAARAAGCAAAAYVTVLPPTDPAALPAHHRALAEAGAGELHVYHLGLAPRDREPLLAAAAGLDLTGAAP